MLVLLSWVCYVAYYVQLSNHTTIMARITKVSLEEFAKEVAVLEAAEATILS